MQTVFYLNVWRGKKFKKLVHVCVADRGSRIEDRVPVSEYQLNTLYKRVSTLYSILYTSENRVSELTLSRYCRNPTP